MTAASDKDNDAMAAARDASDPQYLLKLFDDQKKRADPKEAATKSRPPAPDAFAPFLKSWLGTSPVRAQVMDQFNKGSEVGGPAVGTGGGSADFRPLLSAVPTGSGTGLPPPAGQAKPNPYLVELNAPLPVRESSTGIAPAASVDQLLPGGAGPVASPLTPALLAPLPDVRSPAKGPPPGLTDDKKYFPQQKKF